MVAKKSGERARFETSWRGYARAQVEKAIAEYEETLDEASRRIAHLESEVEKRKDLETAAMVQAFFSLLEVKERMLANAEERAEAILADARQRADAVDAHSGSRPSSILDDAQRQADELLQAAKDEAALVQEEAENTDMLPSQG